MKNKLTRLSILLFVMLLTMGALVVFTNPFNLAGTHSSSLVAGIQTVNSNTASGQGASSGVGLSQSPTGGSSGSLGAQHGGNDDGGYSGNDDGGSDS